MIVQSIGQDAHIILHVLLMATRAKCPFMSSQDVHLILDVACTSLTHASLDGL